MSVEKRPNGRWRARYRDGDGREHARHFDTQREARAWEAHQRSLVARGEHLASPLSALTLTAYMEQYYFPGRVLATGTITGTRLAVRTSPYADRPLAKIRRAEGERWLAEMMRVLAHSTAAMRFTRVSGILRSAVENEVLPRNPLAGVRVPPMRASRVEREDVPMASQVVDMMEGATTPTGRTMILTMAVAGLRVGELIALQARDVRVDAGELRVERQLQKVTGKPREMREPKYGSVRTIPIPATLVEALVAQAELVGATGERWLFPGPSMVDAVSANAVSRVVQIAAAWARAPFHPHSLRHFCASSLLASGLPVTTVAQIMGHRNVATTLNTYGHLVEDAWDRARAASEGISSALLRTDPAPLRTERG